MKKLPNTIYLLLIYLLLVSSNAAFSDQTVIPNYNKSKTIFWNKLYPTGNWTIYCGVRFNNRKSTIDGRKLSIEHVYPQSWIAKSMGCSSVSECRKTNNRFNFATADLHNMYPALRNVNSSRGNSLYGIIHGENWRYEGCDIERAKNVTEPREIARGNLARSILYMSLEYELPIPEKMVTIIQEWNETDPPSLHELRRNRDIKMIQGTSNPYIQKYTRK